MELLRLLDGVDWPTASTILHFGDEFEYPILDYRALWSLGYEKPPRYTMEFWLAYLKFTRRLAGSVKTTVRASTWRASASGRWSAACWPPKRPPASRNSRR